MTEHEGTAVHDRPPADQPAAPADRHGWVELESFASMFGYGRRWALGEHEAGRLQCRYIGRRLVTRHEWIADWTRRMVEGEDGAQ